MTPATLVWPKGKIHKLKTAISNTFRVFCGMNLKRLWLKSVFHFIQAFLPIIVIILSGILIPVLNFVVQLLRN